MGAKHSVTLNMGGEPPLPVRMGAKHSVTLSMGFEPPLPVRMGAKHSVTLYRSGGAHKVQLKVVFLILKYYLGLALCIDSYVVVFFCPSC